MLNRDKAYPRLCVLCWAKPSAPQVSAEPKYLVFTLGLYVINSNKIDLRQRVVDRAELERSHEISFPVDSQMMLRTGPFRRNINFFSHGEMLGRRTYLLRVFTLKTRSIPLFMSSSLPQGDSHFLPLPQKPLGIALSQGLSCS